MNLEKFDCYMNDEAIDDIFTEDELGSEMKYHTLLRTIRDAEKYNYHSDYWGDADTYQEKAIDTVSRYTKYVNKEVIIPYDDDNQLHVKILGFLIDNKYNGHPLKILIEEIKG